MGTRQCQDPRRGVQGRRQARQEARGQVLQRPGQERRRIKEEDISLWGEKGVGTTQRIRNFLSPAAAQLASQAGQADSNTHLSDAMK